MASELLLLPCDTSNSAPVANNSARKLTEKQLAALKAHAFQPGHTGNPKGRPVKPLADKLLHKLVRKRHAEAEAICDAIIAKAKEGDVPAFTAIRDTVEGKPVQRVEGDQAIHITVTRIGD